MRDDPAPLAAHLVDVLSDRATAEQQEQVERWIRERPEHGVMIAQVRRALQARRPRRAPADIDAIVRAVNQRIGVSSAEEALQTGALRDSATFRKDTQTDSSERPGRLQGYLFKKQPLSGGAFKAHSLRWFLSTVLNRLAGSAIAALFGRHVTTLTTAEITELQDLVEHAEPEDE